jgi:hypothetical protein
LGRGVADAEANFRAMKAEESLRDAQTADGGRDAPQDFDDLSMGLHRDATPGSNASMC